MSQQEQNPSQSFLAGIKKLVNQILLVSNVPRQQIRYEHIGKCTLSVNHCHHSLLLDAHNRAIGYGACGAHPEGLPYKTTFSKEIARAQNAYRGFLSGLR
jgi:hypothetical protein